MSSQSSLDDFIVTVFSHDSYILYLPSLQAFSYPQQKFIQETLGYQNLKDIKQRKIKIAPVIRLYGTNPFGQKCCMHVHGYFPYFYIKAQELSSRTTPSFLRNFADNLEKAYNIAYSNPNSKKNPKLAKYGIDEAMPTEIKATFKQYIIHDITIVEKYDFYGYHTKKEKFMKVRVYDPKYVKPLCKILTSGAFMEKKFQTYESHITYFMHFYSDCNIFGMSEVKVINYKFRRNYDENKMRIVQKIFVEQKLNDSLDYLLQQPFDLVELEQTSPEYFSSLLKGSTCYIELDVQYENIINKIFHDLQVNDFFTQSSSKSSRKSVTNETFEVRITKALNQFWQDEQQRRNLLNIKDPLAFDINYEKNIDVNLDAVPKEQILGDFSENLSCNIIWDEMYRNKLIMHVQGYYESMEKKKQEIMAKDEGDNMEKDNGAITYNENQLINFFNVLIHEKNAMAISMSSRLQEWSRRMKENKRLRKLLNEDQLKQDGTEDEYEDPDLDDREDVKAIESSINQINSSIFRPGVPQKVKFMKNQTFPKINFCKKCSRDVFSCVCHQRIFQVPQKSTDELIEEIREKANDEQEETNNMKSLYSMENTGETLSRSRLVMDKEEIVCKFRYVYKRQPPKLNEIIESQKLCLNEDIYQEPYFENSQDLLDYMKLKPITPSPISSLLASEKTSYHIKESISRHSIQFLVNSMIKNNYVSIRNELKFPDFIRFYTNYEIKYSTSQISSIPSRVYLYTKKPPNLQDILISNDNEIKAEKIEFMKKDSKNAEVFSYISPIKGKAQGETLSQITTRKIMTMITNLITFGFEIFAKSKPNILPNPEFDSINCLLFLVTNEKIKLSSTHDTHTISGLILIDNIEYDIMNNMKHKIKTHYKANTFDEVILVKTEIDLIYTFITLVFKFDPDIIYGYDVEKSSLFYIAVRALNNGFDMMPYLSRSPKNIDDLYRIISLNNVQFDESSKSFLNSDSFTFNKHSTDRSDNNIGDLNDANDTIASNIEDGSNIIGTTSVDESGINADDKNQNKNRNKTGRKSKKMESRYNHARNYTLNFHINGRILLNVWRIAEFDLKLTNFDLESVIFLLFNKREPQIPNWIMSLWYDESIEQRSLVINYLLKKLRYTERIIDCLNLLPRTAEMSKLYGIDFDSVLARGSQFKIEAVIIRVTKSNDYLLLSASKLQVANQKILECVPLVLEPPKQFISDPVIVLDFQSLYPSVMIAYNYCYSTCLGHMDDLFLKGNKRIGVNETTNIDFESLFGNDYTNKENEELIKNFIISPNKVVFVRKNIREGMIPRVLQEFLNTRIMIKRSSKYYEDIDFIQKIMEHRQLALKLFMNVMYGYAGASFSGRMPCSDIADAVVETGKTILKNAIKYIEDKKGWMAKVIYGDTDSLFVLLKGRSIQSAFEIGKLIAKEITRQNPYPIELKFEKVYLPMILFAKKRYVGLRYDTPVSKPYSEGKGIETVRRDGCDALVKIMNKCIDMLFKTKNLSTVKIYLQKQWAKISKGHVNFKDFIIAKEVRMGKYVSLPPAALVSLEMQKQDPMLMPKYKERVKYLVITSKEGSRLKDLVVSVRQFLKSHNYKLNTRYYIEKVINQPLVRLFDTIKIDVNDWYANLPKGLNKVNLLINPTHYMGSTTKCVSKNFNYNLEYFYRFQVCILCFEPTEKQLICNKCKSNEIVCMLLAQTKIKYIDNEYNMLENTCRACAGFNLLGIEEVPCEFFDCPVYYSKMKAKDKVIMLKPTLQAVLIQYENDAPK